MANPWFRLYAEFATDPKVQMLSEADQRRFVMILCLKCCNGDVTLQDEEVAFQLRISKEEWLSTKTVLLAKGLISDDNIPPAWNKRQFVSDSSAERVARHRESKKQKCNVTVTPPDTDTDTDTDTDITSATKKVAGYLAFKIKNYTPSAIPKPHAWIADIDKAIRIDQRTEKDLMEIIDWIYSGGGGDFWIPNILSGKKLREKYDMMLSQMKNGEKKMKPEVPWFLSALGIEAKAGELNITPCADEPFPYFKARVLAAAGVSTTDSKKGKMALRTLTAGGEIKRHGVSPLTAAHTPLTSGGAATKKEREEK